MALSAAEMGVMSRLLDEALPLDVAGRRRWLEQLRPEHVALIEALREALLQSGNETSGAGQFATLPKIGSDPESGASKAGDEVGPYQLIRKLGSGGMGAVWLAERFDGAYQRQVALKLPRLAWAQGLAERMRRERDILAALEHPHIARLYDAGLDAQGRPYLALEYVEGEPIDCYVKRHKLPVRARLALFLQVAEAVAHAHGRLVVHRDLKPSNILVNGEGQVQLLDFGIAKLLEADLAGATRLTDLAGAAMTPDYASPEQLRGETITVSSDVYSLGAVLYELLTAHRPYEFKGGAAAAVAEAMADTDVPVASRQAAEKDTQRTLRGDLDTILTKALKKDPAQRYPTVESFAADIMRYLGGRPVLARPDSTAYRMRKFIARHKIGVAGSLVTLLAFITTGAAIWQARRAELEANRDIANYNDAVRLNPRDPYAYFIRGIAWTVKGAHDRAISDFNEAIQFNPLYAAAYNSRGIAKYKSGDLDGAIADYTSAIGLPNAPVEQVAKALYNRGFTSGERGDRDGAIADYTTAIELLGAPAQIRVMALNNRGFTKGERGDRDGAIADFTAAIQRRNAPPEVVASAFVSRGVSKRQGGDSDGAIADFTAAIELRNAPAQMVAIALINRGYTRALRNLGNNGIWNLSSDDYTAVIELPNAPADLVAQALCLRGVDKGYRGDLLGAIADYKAALELSTAPAQLVAPALINRGFDNVERRDIDRRIADLSAIVGAEVAQPSKTAH